MNRVVSRLLFAAVCAALIGAVVAGCGSSSSSSSTDAGKTLVLYSAQHEAMTESLAKGFEETSGAKVEVREGEDEELAAQVEQEGSASPADAILTENTPPLESLAEKGLLAPVDKSTLEQVPAELVPTKGTGSGSPPARR